MVKVANIKGKDQSLSLINNKVKSPISKKTVHPAVLLTMLKMKEADNKGKKAVLESFNTGSKDLDYNIFMLLADLEHKCRDTNQDRKSAVLSKAATEQATYQSVMKSWQEKQTQASSVQANTTQMGSTTKASFSTYLGIIGAAIPAVAVGFAAVLAFGIPVVGAIIAAVVVAAVTYLVAAAIQAARSNHNGGNQTNLFSAFSKSHFTEFWSGTNTSDSKNKLFGRVDKEETVANPNYQKDLDMFNNKVQEQQTHAQTEQQQLSQTMSGDFDPLQQQDSSTMTLYNSILNWFGDLGKVFQ